MIIAFEGIGGSGKTEQINKLAHFLNSKRKTFIILKGGGTGGNTKDLQELKSKIDKSGDPENLLLGETIKHQLVELNKAKASKIDFIILDRTPFTYYASAESKDLKLKEIFSKEMMEDLKKFPSADLVLFLNITPKNAHKLMEHKEVLSRGDLRATIERDEYKNKAYKKYAKNYDWIIIDVDKNKSIRDKNSIHEEIIAKVNI